MKRVTESGVVEVRESDGAPIVGTCKATHVGEKNEFCVMTDAGEDEEDEKVSLSFFTRSLPYASMTFRIKAEDAKALGEALIEHAERLQK